MSLTPERFSAFVASGDERSLRFPYMPFDVSSGSGSIMRLLGQLTERMKAQFMLACIRHAWETNVRYDVGSKVPEETFAIIDDLLEARHHSLAELETRIEIFQEVFEGIQAAAKEDAPGAVLAANVTYVTGEFISFLYHALVAAAADPELTWTGYSGETDRWLPLWLVLDGTASTGGEEERAWQALAMEGFGGDAPSEMELSPEWVARTAELGPMLMTLWVAPWDEKRAIIESEPDLLEPSRSLFTKLVALKGLEQQAPDSQEAFATLIDLHVLLLFWCNAAITDAREAGIDESLAFDAVFTNGPLRSIVEQHAN